MNGPLPPSLAERWKPERELVAEEDLRRWEATDQRSAELVELVCARAHALMRPGAREGFDQVSFDHPAVLPVHERLQTEHGTVLVRPRVQGTLIDVRLEPSEALALAEWLLPAIAAGDGAFGGELRPEDVAVDLNGRPLLAAIRLPRPESLSRVPSFRAPEVLAGEEPTAASDLFGLGVLLFRAVTGGDPWPASSASQLRRRETAAPRLSSLQTVPPELDELVARLLDLDPETRLGALDLRSAEVTSPDPPRLVLDHAHDAPAVRGTTLAQRPTSAPNPPWVVVTPLAGADAAVLRRIALRSGVELGAVEKAAARGVDWVLETAESEGEAHRLARRLQGIGLKTLSSTTRAPQIIQWALLALGALIPAPFVGFPLAWGFLAIFALSFALGARAVTRSFPVARARLALVERQRAPMAGGPEGRAWALDHRLRESEHLPAALRSDLREALEAMVENLEKIAATESGLPPTAKVERKALGDRRAAISNQLTRLELELARAGAELLVDGETEHLDALAKLAREVRQPG